MFHTVMIVMHTLAATIAFASGSLALLAPVAEQRTRHLVRVYVWSLVLMAAFLAGAIVAHWRQLETAEQVIFPGLLALAMYMVRRALLAEGLLVRHNSDWQLPYMEHVGFTLIALWDGFVIILAVDLGAPGWLVAVLAVLGVVAGNRALYRAKPNTRATG